MKVALVCPYDWSYPGGVRSHISGLAAALTTLGVDVTIIAPSSRPETGIVRAGSTFGVRANGSTARISFSPSSKRKVRSVIENGGYDLVHVHEPLIPSVSLLALNASPVPCVGTFHTSRASSIGYRLAGPVLRRAASRLRGRIAVSESAKDFAAKYFPSDYTIIPNGLDTRRFREAPRARELEDLRPLVLFVGRGEPRKGLPVLLKAMEDLRQTMDVRLVTVGPTVSRRDPWITSMTRVSDERLPSIYRSADVFCAPSLGGESFGIVLAEAMAAEVPVVCSDLPGYREAAGEAALYCTPGDPDQLRVRLAEALDPVKRKEMIEEGIHRSKQLDWSGLSARISLMYSRALSSAQHLEKGE
ncbi:MAG TPA: glycosyltransferase family 4 protein [Actinomycetota bacterium]|nr:glycosyltransferase family 4 protein [Actinomycetota bacterium]